MAVTWQTLKRTSQLNLDIGLLNEIRNNLREGRKVRIGQSLLTRRDLKDVNKLIDKEYRKNGGRIRAN